MRAATTSAAVGAGRQHQRGEPGAPGEAARRAARARGAGAACRSSSAARGVADQVEAPQDLAEERAGEQPSAVGLRRPGRRRSPARRSRRAPAARRPRSRASGGRRTAATSIAVIIVPRSAACRPQCSPTIAWLPWSAERLRPRRARRQARAAVDHRGVVPGLPRDGSHHLRGSRGRRAGPRSLRRRSRRHRPPSRHQRALQPRRLADDGLPDGGRRVSSPAAPSCPRIGCRACSTRVAVGVRTRRPRITGRRREDRGREPPMPVADAPRIDADTQLIESVFATFDEEHGGFGVEPKFPHTAPLHLAMALFRETGDDRWRTIVERTLDAMAEGGLWDARGGGFYRYSTRARLAAAAHREAARDQRRAAARLRGGGAGLRRQVDRDRCAAIAGFITGALRAESRAATAAATPTGCSTWTATPRPPARWSAPRPSSTTARSPGKRSPRSSA